MANYRAYLSASALNGLPLPLTVLKAPLFTSLGVDRGVLICSPGMVDFLLERDSASRIHARWLLIDSMQHYGFGQNESADLHMIASPNLIGTYLSSEYAHVPYTTLGDGGDFVSPLFFYPINPSPEYDVVLIGSWAPIKRHKHLLESARILRESGSPIRLLLMGSYCVPGHVDTMQEALDYEAEIRKMVVDYRLDATILSNSDVSHNNADGSSVLGQYTKEDVNRTINQAKIGVLPSLVEGTTRFVAECLCANRPVVILNSLQAGTKKYINPRTGLLAGDSAEELGQTIRMALNSANAFAPRQSFLAEYGFHNANRILEAAIQSVVEAQGDQLFSMPHCQFGGDMWSRDYQSIYEPVMAVP
ncbi:MAG: glycosyltransferase [Chloroflexi bacterium]|nr:glycosyltransferase [Chloroflexota bacterium]